MSATDIPSPPHTPKIGSLRSELTFTWIQFALRCYFKAILTFSCVSMYHHWALHRNSCFLLKARVYITLFIVELNIRTRQKVFSHLPVKLFLGRVFFYQYICRGIPWERAAAPLYSWSVAKNAQTKLLQGILTASKVLHNQGKAVN